MGISGAKKQADAKWHKKTYEQIKISVRKSERLGEMIGFAASQKGSSKAQYIVDAIKAQLDTDGVSIERLPVKDGE